MFVKFLWQCNLVFVFDFSLCGDRQTRKWYVCFELEKGAYEIELSMEKVWIKEMKLIAIWHYHWKTKVQIYTSKTIF